MPGRISSEQNKEVLSPGLCGAGLHTCNCSVESLNVIVQMNWPLPARQTLVMQFGALSWLFWRKQDKAGRVSFLSNVPSDRRETSACLDQGSARRSLVHHFQLLYWNGSVSFGVLDLVFPLCCQTKAVCTHRIPVVLLWPLWQASGFAVAVPGKGHRFGQFGKACSSVKIWKQQKCNICLCKCN